MWWYREKAELPATKRDYVAIAMIMNGRLFEDRRRTQQQGWSCVRCKDFERILEKGIIDASARLESSYGSTDLSWIGQGNYWLCRYAWFWGCSGSGALLV